MTIATQPSKRGQSITVGVIVAFVLFQFAPIHPAIAALTVERLRCVRRARSAAGRVSNPGIQFE
jgi:hypothetical protein